MWQGFCLRKKRRIWPSAFIYLVGVAHSFFKAHLLRYHEHAQWQKIKKGKIKVTLSNSTH